MMQVWFNFQRKKNKKKSNDDNDYDDNDNNPAHNDMFGVETANLIHVLC